MITAKVAFNRKRIKLITKIFNVPVINKILHLVFRCYMSLLIPILCLLF